MNFWRSWIRVAPRCVGVYNQCGVCLGSKCEPRHDVVILGGCWRWCDARFCLEIDPEQEFLNDDT